MRFTREQLNRAARERLDGDYPMEVGPRAENTEVMHVNGMTRLVEYVPPKLEVTQLREPGPGPWRLYKADSFDSDFQGSGGTRFNDWDAALAAVKDIEVGTRAYLDDSSGVCILKVVYHPAETHHPW